jgi:hypothetical protein
MGLFQKPAKPPGPAAVDARRRASACPDRKNGRKLLKMREPGRKDMIAAFSLCVPRLGPVGGGWRGEGRCRRRGCRVSRFAIPVPKLQHRGCDGVAPRSLEAKPDAVRRYGRAGGTWTANGVVTDGNTNCHPHNPLDTSLWRRNMRLAKASRSCGSCSARPASTAPRQGMRRPLHQVMMRCAYEEKASDMVCKTIMLTAVLRNFLLRSYPTMKKHNPHTPIMIREASGTEPTVYARFGALDTQGVQTRY